MKGRFYNNLPGLSVPGRLWLSVVCDRADGRILDLAALPFGRRGGNGGQGPVKGILEVGKGKGES